MSDLQERMLKLENALNTLLYGTVLPGKPASYTNRNDDGLLDYGPSRSPTNEQLTKWIAIATEGLRWDV